MNFHTSKDFKDAVDATAQYMKIRPVLVEKDYWVSLVLSNLSASPHRDHVVFKGGTSLSKAYNAIHRFSEDIDLAILNDKGLNDNQLNKIIKDVEKEVTAQLDVVGHPNTMKMGRNRTTIYNYPKVLPDKNFGAVKDYIQLEINSFTNPVPYNTVVITSYVAEFLRARKDTELVEQFDLKPFPLKVLALERTFFEKLLSVNRLSYNGVDALKAKIRHFYDLLQLQKHPALQGRILTPQFHEILALAIKDDEANSTFAGEWMGKPLAASPLFSNIGRIWRELTPVYRSELQDLVWDELPSPEAVLSLLNELHEYVKVFDVRRV